MAKADPLPAATRRAIAQQLGEFLAPAAEPHLAALAQLPRPELAESLAVCTLTAEQVRRPPEDLSALVQLSGLWHHQIHTAAKPTHFARSHSGGIKGKEHTIVQWLASPIAKSVDEAITWVDRHVRTGSATVRLLVAPAYYVHALLIIRGKKYTAVLADQPNGFTHLKPEQEYPLAEFLKLLAQEKPSGTLADTLASAAPAELDALMRQVTPTERDLERRVIDAVTGPRLKETMARVATKKEAAALKAMHAAGGPAMLASAIEGSGDFGGLGWRLFKRLFGVAWDKQGEFQGRYTLEIKGPRDYRYRPVAGEPFRFTRSNGDVIQPPAMTTDAGSIPRIAWIIPNLDPWAYADAYMLHDWLFTAHHCRPDQAGSFDDANLVLGEAIYTMMLTGKVPGDWRKVEIIYEAVSSFVGRQVWDRVWTGEECEATLETS